ncbi:hypothetical protein PLANPX_3680 [Lacipirellula parvula]|uniref:Uncharacterized protein n=1 Tax=Lacipirellula parvula TaxID=2650471 RepID=A0A5K7XC33_9BACT|nr:hypothetical protein PLANPX_3680 [Lacipirellula parvula]
MNQVSSARRQVTDGRGVKRAMRAGRIGNWRGMKQGARRSFSRRHGLRD